jgi:hypothetical protein
VNSSILPHKTTNMNLGVLAVLLVFVYVLSYSPFIVESFLPRNIRIGIEVLLLLLLIVISLNRKYISIDMFWFIPITLGYLCMIFFEISTLSKLTSSFGKFAFLLLNIGLLIKNQRALQNCTKIWIQLSYFLCIMTIIAFVGYNSSIILFVSTNLSTPAHGWDAASSYYHLNHNILGNITPRTLFGIHLGRVSGFMYEPGYLAFYLGFNILVARDWIDDTRLRKRFVWLNVVAGITTFSTTFFLFFAFYFLAKEIKSKGNSKIIMSKRIVFLTLTVFFIVLILKSGYAGETSASARLGRLVSYSSIIVNNSWLSFLFGNGIGVSAERFGIGIDSGWIKVFIEKGVVLLVILVTLFTRLTKHNRWLMLYVFYCNFALNLFSTPLFLFLISISYASSFAKKRQLSNTNIGQINCKIVDLK